MTRIAAMLLSVVMIGALIYVKQDLGIISTSRCPAPSSTWRCSPG